MKRLALLTIVVVSSVASLFSQAEKAPKLFASFSIKTDGTGLAMTINLASCFETNLFHLSMNDNFTKHFGVCADFIAHFDNHANSPGPINQHSDLCPRSNTIDWRLLVKREPPNPCVLDVDAAGKSRMPGLFMFPSSCDRVSQEDTLSDNQLNPATHLFLIRPKLFAKPLLQQFLFTSDHEIN